MDDALSKDDPFCVNVCEFWAVANDENFAEKNCISIQKANGASISDINSETRKQKNRSRKKKLSMLSVFLCFFIQVFACFCSYLSILSNSSATNSSIKYTYAQWEGRR